MITTKGSCYLTAPFRCIKTDYYETTALHSTAHLHHYRLCRLFATDVRPMWQHDRTLRKRQNLRPNRLLCRPHRVRALLRPYRLVSRLRKRRPLLRPLRHLSGLLKVSGQNGLIEHFLLLGYIEQPCPDGFSIVYDFTHSFSAIYCSRILLTLSLSA